MDEEEAMLVLSLMARLRIICARVQADEAFPSKDSVAVLAELDQILLDVQLISDPEVRVAVDAKLRNGVEALERALRHGSDT